MVNAPPPRQRFVLIGASNVAVGLPTILEMARRGAGEPLEMMVATTLGRSFGKKSKIFARRISGILDCPLWKDLESRPPLPTRALVTDIGNDILYGVSVDRIAEWVAQCVERLRNFGASVSLSQLPIESVSELSSRRFATFRRLFFPRSTLTLAAAKGRTRELNDRLLEIANRHELQAISHDRGWYGFDPIHFRRRHRGAAWRAFLEPLFRDLSAHRATSCSWSNSTYLYALAPAERWLFGIPARRAQPAGRLWDGTTISLY